jgi:putative nucleotidyltransferase with HDIG domain
VLSPAQLLSMLVLQHLPDWVRQRYVWYIQPFNIANYVLAGGTAMLAVDLVRASGGGGIAVEARAGIAAVLVFVAVNRFLLAAMLRVARSLSFNASGLFRVDDLAVELVLATMAVPLAVLWNQSALLAFISLAPLVLIHITQRTSLRLEHASETIQEQNASLLAANELIIERSTSALEALSATVDARDSYTAGHSRRVRDFSLLLGRALRLTEREMELLAQAALLHDIGKIGVPDAVLLKEAPLDDDEWVAMRAHAEEGARIIQTLGYLEDLVPIIRHHHERYDGRGYPDGICGEAIPLAAQIIHVADSLDAMTSRRVYRGAMPFERALMELRGGRGSDYSPNCIDALEECVNDGSLLELFSADEGVEVAA